MRTGETPNEARQIWSATIHRRFPCFRFTRPFLESQSGDQSNQDIESGNEFPHSKFWLFESMFGKDV